MSAKLGHPVRDPHGDPIPDATGRISMPPSHRLDELDPGHTGRISRISDHDPELLRHLESIGIGLDTQLTVLGRPPFGAGWQVSLAGPSQDMADAGHLTLGDEVAASLWLASVGTHPGCAVAEFTGGTLMSGHSAD